MKKRIALLIIIVFFIGSLQSVFGANPADYNWDYKRVMLKYKASYGGDFIDKPIASLTVSYNGNTVGDNQTITIPLGASVTLNASGCKTETADKITEFDFQIARPGEYPKGAGTEVFTTKSYKPDEVGKWHFYLCVRGNIPSSQIRENWDDWSDNGSTRVKGRYDMWWYFVDIEVNVVGPSTPPPTPRPTRPPNEPTDTPEPTGTPTPTATPMPTIANPSLPPAANGLIKFNPDSSTWRNSDLNVRVYVEGDKTVEMQDQYPRSYNYSWTEYVPAPEPSPGCTPLPPTYISHTSTSSVFFTFRQSWSIDKIYNWGAALANPVTIPDNNNVTVTKEGINNIHAMLTGWIGGNKYWYPPGDTSRAWISSSININTDDPSQNYASNSGAYKIDKTDPTITYDWSNQDGSNGNIHMFYYVPGQKINFSLFDKLSGVSDFKYLWTNTSTFPNLSTLKDEPFSTNEITYTQFVNGQSPSSVAYSINIHDTQQRIGLWYLHVTLADRAGNRTNVTVPVNIRVDLFDFKITSITDRSWEDIFRNEITKQPTGKTYPVSQMPVDLHPTKKVVPKKGYSFEFKLNSHGLNDAVDKVVMTPKFYLAKDLSPASIANAPEVDLYYNVGNNYFVKYGESRDTYQFKQKIGKNEYPIGGFNGLILDNNVKTTINTKVQSWVGKYGLSQSTVAVIKGTPIIKNNTLNTSAIIKNGLILINFKIDAYKGDKLVFSYKPDPNLRNNPTLAINNNPDQWTVEGGPKVIMHNGSNIFYPGDTIFFDNLYSAKDDYQIGTDR